MASLYTIILHALNPFEYYVTGDVTQHPIPTDAVVERIHQQPLERLEGLLESVQATQTPHTAILTGQSGSGKTFLLGRLRERSADRARFAYVGPWSDASRIWRHTLRCTLESLTRGSAEALETPLETWFRGLQRREANETREAFAKRCQRQYSAENPLKFFRIVYGLGQLKLRPLVQAWLAGDELDPEDLRSIGARQAIDNEDDARQVLMNLIRVNPDDRPLILCFDQLDNVPQRDGQPDLHPLFQLNTRIHTSYGTARVFVVINLITETFINTRRQQTAADLARIDKPIDIKALQRPEIEAVWRQRLAPLHAQADPTPNDPLAPLDTLDWDHAFPTGRALIRNALVVARDHVQAYKQGRLPGVSGRGSDEPGSGPTVNSFRLVWENEFRSVQSHVPKIAQAATEDLIWYLTEALDCLGLSFLERRFLKPQGSTAQYVAHIRETSLGFSLHGKTTALIWSESDNLTQFHRVLKVAEAAIHAGKCDRFLLVRHGRLGNSSNKGYQLYRQLIDGTVHRHIRPDRIDITVLKTLHALMNQAKASDLLVDSAPVDTHQLKALVKASGVLERSELLKTLGVLPTGATHATDPDEPTTAIRQFVQGLLEGEMLLGLSTLEERTRHSYPHVDRPRFDAILDELLAAGTIGIRPPDAPREHQLVYRMESASGRGPS
jgi:hypothetical protein